MSTDEHTTLQPPFIEHGQTVTETKFNLSGSITHPLGQPARAYPKAGERRIFVVVAYTDGFAVKPTGGDDSAEVVWTNQLKAAEAFEITDLDDLGDATDSEGLVELCRDELRAELNQLPIDDTPDITPQTRAS